MPKNKRPNRKPGGRKTGKRAAADKTQSGGTEASGGAPNLKGRKFATKSYGSPYASRSPASPAMRRGSTRNR